VFVGSFKLDPRSTSLNCEQGVFVDNEVVGSRLEEIFAAASAGARAWQVYLDDGKPRWTDGAKIWDETPEAFFAKKFQSWLARILPITSHL
jgi:putative cardiolipin synthase